MKITIDSMSFDISNPIDISIPTRFNGPQPNVYNVAPAVSTACEYGSLRGDTRMGGSCNFEQVTLIPHCNGTHTECVGHITIDRIAVRDCLRDSFVTAELISIEPERKDRSDDLLISRASLVNALRGRNISIGSALIIRTCPNDESKLSRAYAGGDPGLAELPPYFTPDAMAYVTELGIKHLLTDLPSVDRVFDQGKLLNHRIFWNIPAGKALVDEHTRTESTITELIFVPNEVQDGTYLLNLQIAPFQSEASPSRPLIFHPI
jgi:kynurenine formamidase